MFVCTIKLEIRYWKLTFMKVQYLRQTSRWFSQVLYVIFPLQVDVRFRNLTHSSMWNNWISWVQWFRLSLRDESGPKIHLRGWGGSNSHLLRAGPGSIQHITTRLVLTPFTLFCLSIYIRHFLYKMTTCFTKTQSKQLITFTIISLSMHMI